MRTETFRITGMTCQGCKRLIEAELRSEPGIKSIAINLAGGTGTAEFDENVTGPDRIKAAIERLNYRADLSLPDAAAKPGKSWLILAGLALAFVFLYFGADRLGAFRVLERLNDPAIGYPLIFLVGFIASFHCVGMCGGFIVSYSTAAGAAQGRLRPHLFYNAGRLISYSAIGAVLGTFGSFFAIDPAVSGALLAVSALLMAVMGAAFLAGKPLPALPGAAAMFRLAQKALPESGANRAYGPFVIGLLTGFMPCGPLQAMQVYALTTGSAAQGALSMAVYVLGTAPLLLSFGTLISWAKNKDLKRFFKYSGAVIILLAAVTMNRALNNFGLGFGQAPNQANVPAETKPDDGNVRTVNMDVTYRGFAPNTLYAKKGEPVRWVINGKEVSGCTNEIIMPEYGIKQKIAKGINVVEFTPDRTGEIKFSCWMKMVWGKFIISE